MKREGQALSNYKKLIFLEILWVLEWFKVKLFYSRSFEPLYIVFDGPDVKTSRAIAVGEFKFLSAI